MPGFIDNQNGIAKVGEPFYIWINSTANKRLFWGPVEFAGFRVNSQTSAGTLKFYDGLDNTGTLIWSVTSTVVDTGAVLGPLVPIYCRYGLYVEHGGTAQNVDTLIGD